MKAKFVLSLIVLSISLFPMLLHAQFSFVPKPLPECKTFLITEIGYAFRLSSVPEGLVERRHHIISDSGIMVNLNSNYAVGINNFFGFESASQFRWGMRVRARRWLNNRSSIDLSLGLNFLDSRGIRKTPQFSSEVSFNFRDLANLVILLEVTDYDITRSVWDTGYVRYTGKDTSLSTGLKFGRKIGLIGNIGYAIVGAVVGAIWIFSSEG